MRKLVFIVSVFVLSALFADGSTEKSNWIYYDGWVTGPGSDKNKDTYLLPFMFTNVYSDESPLLYETDMGWPVPDEEEKNLKYLFFGDTYFFMRDSKNNIMSKITDGSETLLDFGVDNNAAEISRQSNFLPEGGIHLTTIIQDIYDSCLEDCLKENQNGSDSCARYCYNKLVNNPEDHCLDDCLKEYPESEYCEKSCINKFANKTNYSDCFSFCNDCEALKNEPDIFDYMDFKSGSKEDICKNFCQFDMVDTYTPGQYFSYDFNDNPTNGQVYNNGTSNIFLAATLEKNNSGNNTRYNIKFHHPDNEESGSAQIYSVADATKRRSKSIWMDSYERSFLGFIGIYPRGYFYACPESQGNDCGTKKLFVPYMIRNWNLFNTQIFGENLRIHLNLPDDTQFIITGSNLDKDLTNLFQKLKAKGFKFYDFDKEFARQSQSLGHGIYDFDKEYRMVFSKGTTYPNKHVLWPFSSKMSNMTVIHDISRDLLSIDDNKEYVYFMGTGEIEIDSSKFYIKRKKEKNGYVYEFVTKDGYKAEDVVKSTQKAYIARVPAYEKEIKYAASYEYFTGITNGIARWKKDINKAKPLYGFYPLTAMGAESIVQHRDLYWMTASLNETTTTKTHENKKGVAVLASPDALHWQKVDTILFDNPESIGTNYAFFWLPPKLIEEDDNTMPFLYSIWKADKDATSGKFNLKGFLDDSLDPKFTHYNLKAGKYKFMEKSATRAFLADNAEYGYTFLNTIPGNTPEGTKDFPISYFVSGKIPLPFKTFQNLDNLKHAGLTGSELNAKKEELKNRYAVIEYCYCGNQNEEQCKKFDTGNCPPYKDFIQTEEKGNDVGNWKIIDIVENKFFEEHVKICKNGNENIPDYMCNIPFEHGKASPQGQRSIPVWNWWKQIAADYPTWNKDSAKVILRFSHWQDIGPDEKLTFEQGNYIKINKQLMENNKLVPFDCDGSGSSEITATCQDPTSWRTSNQLTLKFRPFSDFMIDPRIDLNFASLPKIRLEYLYPYPVMISDYGKPGDPAPWTWDMFVADHFAKEFFKVGSFEYGDSVTQSLMPGAAMTAAIKNGTMQIYAWGGENQNLIKRNIVQEQLLHIGTFNAETETVSFEQTALAKTEGTNSPVLTAGTSMVYDDEKEEIYLIGAIDETGTTRIYMLDNDVKTGLKTWRNVTQIDLGRYFRLVKKSEREYFAFGGQKTDGTFNTKVFLINLDDISNPKQITTIPEGGSANSFAAYNEKNGKLYIFGGLDSDGTSGRFLSFDTRTAVWNTITAAGGPGAGYGGVILVDYITETISLGGGVFENPENNRFKWIFDEKNQSWTKELKNFKESFCISETDNSIFPGITNVYGECVKVENYDFDEVTFPDYKLSVAGYRNSLYLGGLTGIRRIEIGENGEITKKEMIYSGESNNLAVYGNTLYAANYSEIDIFEIAEDGSIERKSSVKTNNCQNIRINGGKLFAAENKRVRIFDLNDPIAPKLLKTISLSNAVEDLEIATNRLFVYENLNGLLTRKGKVTVFDVSDIANPNKIKEFNQYCNDPEMQKSQDNVYLGCKNGVFKIEENGLKSVSGSKNYLREGYAFDGILYQVFSGTLHESKVESEEIEEDGWF